MWYPIPSCGPSGTAVPPLVAHSISEQHRTDAAEGAKDAEAVAGSSWRRGRRRWVTRVRARERPPRAHVHQRDGTRIDGPPRAGARARIERTGDAGGLDERECGWPPMAAQRIQDEIKADNYQVSGRALRATGGDS